MLVGRGQKMTDIGAAGQAKKRPLSILLLTGSRADLALQLPRSRGPSCTAKLLCFLMAGEFESPSTPDFPESHLAAILYVLLTISFSYP
jgi:hypothetical protein